jgi:LiaI-LiaF-like transmembrane region
MWDKIGPFVLIFVGVMFLLDNLGLPSLDFGDLVKLWPLILIWLGWDMLRNKDGKKNDPDDRPPENRVL